MFLNLSPTRLIIYSFRGSNQKYKFSSLQNLFQQFFIANNYREFTMTNVPDEDKQHDNEETPLTQDGEANNPASGNKLQSWDRLMKLPVLDAAWNKTQNVYGKVKDEGPFFEAILSTAEDLVSKVSSCLSPYVSEYDSQIKSADEVFLKGIEKLETNAPIVKETPEVICETIKNKAKEFIDSLDGQSN